MEENVLPAKEEQAQVQAQAQEPMREKRGVGTNRLWYAALVPLFGIYIEMFADSFMLGLLVWIMALILSPAACLLDYKFLEKKGIYSPTLKPAYALLPPLYIIKRTKLTGDSQVCGIVWCILFVFAVASNGFSRSLMLTSDDMVFAISENTWSSISETSDVSCDKTIGESLEEIAGCELTWYGNRADGFLSVTASGENGFGARFHIDYDGYAAKDHHLTYIVTADGSAYDGEDAADIIRKRYPDEKTADSSEVSEENQESESAAA